MMVSINPSGFCDGQNWRERKVIHTLSLLGTANVCTECGNVVNIDNEVVRAATAEDKEENPEMRALLDQFQAEDKALSEAGTPYWCEHGYDVDSPQARIIRTGYIHPVRLVPMKHGVVCRRCHGYIQEG
jgi:hypothetical protein